MLNYYHQTKQAFLFSLAFYLLALILLLFKVGFAPVLISVGLLVSLIWIILVLLEVIFSTKISFVEKVLLALFIIVTNILGGVVYFALLRERVVYRKSIKK